MCIRDRIMAESILPKTETPVDQEVMPMAEQIAGLTSSGVTAQQAKPVSRPVTLTLDKLTESPSTTADKAVEEKVVADMVVSGDDVAEEQVVVQAVSYTHLDVYKRQVGA